MSAPAQAAPPVGDADSGADAELLVRRVVKRGYDALSWTFWITLGMSVVLFAAGVLLLALAARAALGEDDLTAGTLAVAGLGAGLLLLLFIARPWRDSGRTLAHAQQVQMISTSYLAGLTLVRQGDDRALTLLDELTRNCVTLLEAFATDGGERGSVRAKLGVLRRARADTPGVLPPPG